MPCSPSRGKYFTDKKNECHVANQIFALENLGPLLVVTPWKCIIKVETLGCRAITFPFNLNASNHRWLVSDALEGGFRTTKLHRIANLAENRSAALTVLLRAPQAVHLDPCKSRHPHIFAGLAQGTYSPQVVQNRVRFVPQDIIVWKDCVISTACKDGFVSGPGHTHCNECPAGTYADSEKTACSVCPAGSFSSEKGVLASGRAKSVQKILRFLTMPRLPASMIPSRLQTLSRPHFQILDRYCERCSVGKHLARLDGKLICEKCDAGKYQSQEGQSFCRPCPPGESQDSTSSQYCLPCAPGRFASEAGSSKCMECPTGYVQASPGETSCTM